MTKKKRKPKPEERIKRHGPVPFEARVRIVQAVMRGSRQSDVALAFGVSVAVVQKFMTLFEAGGMDALRIQPSGAAVEKAKRRVEQSQPRDAVVAMREDNPEWGTRRIRDVLARFEALGVSETTVRRILHEEGLLEQREVIAPRDKPPRRFERAEPNQLWQTDIFTFELRRHQRVYVVGFMDDYSRYLVSWAMAHHHKSSLVIEALERGIAEYGHPREVLTDQGTQYVSWRGETEFQQLLRRYGIAHSKSRPQHPETLGKIERFWKTLWEEFLRKTVFADFADALRRIALFVQHYNFQRPHQGIGSDVPADRFFRAAAHVRAAVEAQVQANALRLAQEKPTQKPFYLVGRLGDQDLSIAAAGGALRVQVGDATQSIPMTKEQDDETKTSHIFVDDETSTPARSGSDRTATRTAAAFAGAQHQPPIALQASALNKENDDEEEANRFSDQSRSSTRATPAWRAPLADWSQGSGSSRTASSAADPVRAFGAHAGDNGDRRAWNLAAAVLPTRDEGAGRDDASAGAWSERSIESRRRDTDAADRRARGEGGPPRAGESSTRPAAAHGEEGLAGGTAGVSPEAGAEAGPALDDEWARTFARLEEAGDDDERTFDFDPDAGWRERILKWDRKLAGADAPTDGELDGETQAAERALDLSGTPDVPPELHRRFELIRAVIGERMTITDAAEALSIARVNMQTMLHRAETAIVESLQPRSTGPKPKPPAERALEAEVARLQKENLKLKKQLQAADEMMGAAGEIIRHLRGLPVSRSSSKRSKRSPKTSGSDEDPEPAPTTGAPTTSDILRRALQRVATTANVGSAAARALGIAVKTARRWLHRISDGQPIVARRGGTRRPGTPAAQLKVRELVRDLHGLIGAEALARSVKSVSRRRAADLKRETLIEIERERQASCAKVSVTRPGIVRGFDAMHLHDGHALISADAAVPFRTTIDHATRYDATSVAASLDADFRIHGAPLVMRFDCARCHDSGAVTSVLCEHRVIGLHGPVHYPRYYGQLERQNREHRAWWDMRLPSSTPIQSQLDAMKNALNELWPRPTLGWRNAAQCWNERPPVDEDRDALLVEVDRRTARLRDSAVHPDLAKRLAIEQALTKRGYLDIRPGRQPLCE